VSVTLLHRENQIVYLSKRKIGCGGTVQNGDGVGGSKERRVKDVGYPW
jgi:hypothetical protein